MRIFAKVAVPLTTAAAHYGVPTSLRPCSGRPAASGSTPYRLHNDSILGGRIPNTPLLNPRHEAVAHALVQGMTCRKAGLSAGYKDGPGLTGNISRLCANPHMQERIAELAAIAGEKAGIEDAWILSRIKTLADSTLANFVRCEDGKLVLDEHGYPIIDFNHATPEQFRTLAVLENDQSGRLKVALRDPISALKLLAKNRGLLRTSSRRSMLVAKAPRGSL